MRTFAKNYAAAFLGRTRPTKRIIIQWLKSSRTLQKQIDKGLTISGTFSIDTERFGTSIRPLAALQLPRLNNIEELKNFLELDSVDELEWLVAPNRLSGLNLTHYNAWLVKKRSGLYRIIESPRSRLKFVQRKILHGILDLVPVSDVCFGFSRGCRIQQFASMHAGHEYVMRMDLESFFPNIALGRVNALWRSLGYPDEVAKCLTWLCTVPKKTLSTIEHEFISNDLARREIFDQCMRDRLPQGAPTSGAISNLIAYRMDRRFMGFANKTNGRYSRYADDLIFSWNSIDRKQLQKVSNWVAATIIECGFRVNFRKTRIMHRSQRQSLLGVVVNQKPNIDRVYRDNLRATIYNCIRFGPSTQNKESHPNFQEYLRGRIAWVNQINPNAGSQLISSFGRIDWKR